MNWKLLIYAKVQFHKPKLLPNIYTHPQEIGHNVTGQTWDYTFDVNFNVREYYSPIARALQN